MPITPQEITERGAALYRERFQREFELAHPGQYLAIDVTTEAAFVADLPEEAMKLAQSANPKGFFHLVRIGSPGVYRVGYTQSNRGWIFQ